MNRGLYALCLVAMALALVSIGCGGGTDSEGESAEVVGITVIRAAKVGDLGQVLVDSEGKTLYDFRKDRRTLYSAKSSACQGACAKEWPPLLTGGEPEAEDGAIDTKLSTFKRRNGALQVTYYGHPLYTYIGDRNPREANGNAVKAFGGMWHTLRPDGETP